MTHNLYRTTTFHSRVSPKNYQFSYRFFVFSINLLSTQKIPWPFNWVFRLKAQDHPFQGMDKNKTLIEKVKNYFHQQGIDGEIQSCQLVTQLRTLGYIFNPVCYYFIEISGKRYCLIEICNTFREVKHYLAPWDQQKKNYYHCSPKFFYISPFTQLDEKMEFVIEHPSYDFRIDVKTYNKNKTPYLHADLVCKLRPWTRLSLLKEFIRAPWPPLVTMLLIHFHALKIFLKKIPYIKKTENSQQQKGFTLWSQ